MDREKCFEIVHSEQKGRYFIATRDIQPLEPILTDLPLVTGPPFKAEDPVCLECLCLLKDPEEVCDRCRFPLCQVHEAGLHWHDVSECRTLQGYQGNVRWYSIAWCDCVSVRPENISDYFRGHHNGHQP